MTKEKAQAALERRAAVAAIAGASLGSLPLLWLIREALDVYEESFRRHYRAESVPPVELLRSGGNTLALTPDGGRLLVEFDRCGARARVHETPNAALVLHDAVKDDPVKAEQLLRTIESATQESLR